MKRLLGALAIITLWALPTLPAHAATDPDAYMNTVASHLGDAGVWVDPDVKELTASEVVELDAAAKSAAAPIRIAVIPAAKINTSDSDYYVSLAWEGEEIADQLYDRVGVEGVYGVLVDAGSEGAGRGFHAVQRADHGPTYYVGDAVDQAVDCCAPDYQPMLERFIQRAQVVNKPFYVDAAPWAGGLAGVIGLWYGVTALGARRQRRRDEKAHLSVTRPLLNEEIIALSQQVSALPTTSDPQQSKLSKDVLDTVEKARHRLDEAESDKDVQSVTTLLGSARYGLQCLDAVRAGKPIPEPKAPCFFDPRHGPSVAQVQWKPEDGAERAVDVCAACKQRDEAGEKPEIRMVKGWQIERPYWEYAEELGAYVDGYWSRGDGSQWWFPDSDFRRKGEAMRARWRYSRPGARFGRFGSNVGSALGDAAASAATGSSDDDGWYSGGSRRRSSWSSRTRSSGGGSSRRSSRRSGGSRGF
ncbi:hypothetical protein [Kribbella kalugense]|uniref:Membrane protein YgcG n=1 Tax=Kribbella kalugense TaxID=2512221 RepID=A0A4R7ZFB3_9ACTN|nr:hypothetical protein [Kribbella kalugense]TDW15982.1 hypothetical protein EV650_7476 [Kribbella kalugense]